jgi:hypothetical protein
MAPHADARFDIPRVVPTIAYLLCPCVCSLQTPITLSIAIFLNPILPTPREGRTATTTPNLSNTGLAVSGN